MTPQEFARDLQNKVESIKRTNRPFALGVSTAHARMTKRIFTQGKDSSGGQIGTYSTKDIWVNPKTARNDGGFTPPTGKTGRSVFESTGKPHLTSYFKGWKGFREAQHLKTDHVRLSYSGDLESDFSNGVKKVDTNNYELVLSRVGDNGEINVKKARGNEKHFGKIIFTPSEEEKKVLWEKTEKELKLLLIK